jgi:hypothetical protein
MSSLPIVASFPKIYPVVLRPLIAQLSYAVIRSPLNFALHYSNLGTPLTGMLLVLFAMA